jgi:hypothetical protein
MLSTGFSEWIFVVSVKWLVTGRSSVIAVYHSFNCFIKSNIPLCNRTMYRHKEETLLSDKNIIIWTFFVQIYVVLNLTLMIQSTECVQSYGFIKTGQLLDVSEAEVHDCCVKSPLLATDVFQCIHNISGLCSTTSYPKSVGACKNSTCLSVVQVQLLIFRCDSEDDKHLKHLAETNTFPLLYRFWWLSAFPFHLLSLIALDNCNILFRGALFNMVVWYIYVHFIKSVLVREMFEVFIKPKC